MRLPVVVLWIAYLCSVGRGWAMETPEQLKIENAWLIVRVAENGRSFSVASTDSGEAFVERATPDGGAGEASIDTIVTPAWGPGKAARISHLDGSETRLMLFPNLPFVVFDRTRENLKSSKAYEHYQDTVNTSINQSLSRTIITSITTLLAVIALYIFGGNVMRDFSFALIVGIIAGTYSSMFVASALVVEWHKWHPEKLKKT